MKALVVGIGFVVAVTGSMAGVASAGEVLKPTDFQPNPFAMTPPPTPLAPRPASQVPAVATSYVWVPGYVTADGTMVAGGYQPQLVSSGYYQPVWVPGY